MCGDLRNHSVDLLQKTNTADTRRRGELATSAQVPFKLEALQKVNNTWMESSIPGNIVNYRFYLYIQTFDHSFYSSKNYNYRVNVEEYSISIIKFFINKVFNSSLPDHQRGRGRNFIQRIYRK